MCNPFAYIDGNEKRTKRMTVLTNELLNIFHQKVPVSNENIKLTNRVILQPTSTLTRMAVPPQENVPLNQSLPAKLFVPKPQNDPYWLLKRTGNIS